MRKMFFYCPSLKEIDFTNFNTDNVTNMELMLYDCELLKN